MLVQEAMTAPVCCSPWDTVQTAARLMEKNKVDVIVVVADASDPLLEGIVTERDLCYRPVATGQNPRDLMVQDVMTSVPLTCGPHDTLAECADMVEENRLRWIPVINNQARCIGLVTLAEIVFHIPPQEVVTIIHELLKPPKVLPSIRLEDHVFYCGQTHEMDQILLLNRRRELARQSEVLI
jgi:CBS domain-containing protein